MSALLRLVRRTWHWLTRLMRRAAGVAHTAVTRTITLARAAVERLTDRWAADTAYRRTLIAAMSAIAATLLPHPAAAAAVGALISEQSPRSSRRRDPFLDDDDEDEDYPSRRQARATDPWAAAPRRLWDSLN